MKAARLLNDSTSRIFSFCTAHPYAARARARAEGFVISRRSFIPDYTDDKGINCFREICRARIGALANSALYSQLSPPRSSLGLSRRVVRRASSTPALEAPHPFSPPRELPSPSLGALSLFFLFFPFLFLSVPLLRKTEANKRPCS